MSRNRWLWLALPVCGAALAGAAAYTALTGPSRANNAAVADKKGGDGPLPIRQVVLFNSGVGYFQREGDVDGSQRVEITFPVGDINDLLKSLVLQDTRGKIGTVNYDSQDPIDKILRSFALDLNSNPTFGQILNQARGEKIELTVSDKKGERPYKLVGTIVGMEMKKKPADDPKGGGAVEVETLNLATEAGLQSLGLEHVVAVRFLNPVLESEFQRALQVLAHSHDTQKKTVSIGFQGEGKRPVRVGYVVERPIWKTSYRLRLEPNGKLFMQGWAIVENTSDDDWTDVRMVLVSGRPISYKMNLYDPLYLPRPTVEPDLFASLRPPVYGGAMGEADGIAKEKGNPGAMMPPGGGPPIMTSEIGGYAGPNAPRPNNPYLNAGIGGFAGGFGGGIQGGFNGPQGAFQGWNANGMMPQAQLGLNNSNSVQGLNSFQMQTLQRQQQEQLSANADNNRLRFEQLQLRRQQVQAAKDEARKAGGAIAGMNFKEGIASVATADEVGDYYRYAIDQKVSLPRQKSAMLPILDQTIDGSKVSIFNEAVQAKYPLLGLRLKNTSGQPLTQGPITVYEDQSYAGDTRVLDLQPGEERLLSYALDLGTEVKTETKDTPSPHMHFRIGADQLTAKFKLRETKTYTIKNRSPHDRTVIVEHPIREPWKLVDEKAPSEKTRDVYRFQVAVAAGKTVSYAVVEEQDRLDHVGLTTNNDRTPFYAVASGVNVKPVVEAEKDTLVGLKIMKGTVVPTHRTRETKAYYVQNLSDQARDFAIAHVIRPTWVRLDEKGTAAQKGPDVYPMTLTVEKGKTGHREVTEEHTVTEKGVPLKSLSEAKLREYLASPALSGPVRAALEKTLAQQAQVAESQAQLHDLEKQLKAASEDQSRLRENLKIIPHDAAPYKKFLEKFVTQETEIEALQRQVRQVQATLQAQQRTHEEFVSKLNAE